MQIKFLKKDKDSIIKALTNCIENRSMFVKCESPQFQQQCRNIRTHIEGSGGIVPYNPEMMETLHIVVMKFGGLFNVMLPAKIQNLKTLHMGYKLGLNKPKDSYENALGEIVIVID